jgi:hypothetical protein
MWPFKRKRSEEQAQGRQEEEPLTLDEMQGIIADFGEVLERYSGYVAVSEAVLPHPRDRIKRAFRQALIVTTDEQMMNHLEVGYLYLADFLPDPDGSIAMAISPTFHGTLASVRNLPTDQDELLQRVRDDPELCTRLDDPEWIGALRQAVRIQKLTRGRMEAIHEETKACGEFGKHWRAVADNEQNLLSGP